ncbi:MAG: hypothetical protein JWO05_1552 [Gemmatimonadetes bacterium]|nr:hypothetical protein [Gemmatimonadota bacterium]
MTAARLALITLALSACAATPMPSTLGVPAVPQPTIRMLSPVEGAAVPADRPMVVFRLGMTTDAHANEAPLDSADATSFRAWVDGVDRTRAFRFSGEDAWGPLFDPVLTSTSTSASTSMSVVGAHAVSARLCSSRGICTTTHAVVLVLLPATLPAPATSPGDTSTARENADALAPATTRPHSLLGLLLLGLQRILWPPF